ncbi:MAG: DUF4169 family protein [Pseudomonadota bacterium]
MSQPVNLNRFRKAKARDEKRAKADENAVKFGRTKAQREVEEAERDAARKTLDAHRREE